MAIFTTGKEKITGQKILACDHKRIISDGS